MLLVQTVYLQLVKKKFQSYKNITQTLRVGKKEQCNFISIFEMNTDTLVCVNANVSIFCRRKKHLHIIIVNNKNKEIKMNRKDLVNISCVTKRQQCVSVFYPHSRYSNNKLLRQFKPLNASTHIEPMQDDKVRTGESLTSFYFIP